ncbi:MAG: Fic family protein, partial [Pseudomonadota bacterium]
MTTPSEKLAESLDILHAIQAQGAVALRSADLSRTHRERLTKNGFLREVIKGWYIASKPDNSTGESTAWYSSFWGFCAAYLNHLKGDKWVLSPEQSLHLHVDNRTVPKQLLVRSEKARNNITKLLFETSLLDIRAKLPDKANIILKENLRIYSLSAALIACAPGFFPQNPTETRAALAMIKDAADILGPLLDGGHSVIAGRLAGAFRNISRNDIADNILQTMRSAGYNVRESDPFETASPVTLSKREQSPYVNRMKLMWQTMRGVVIDHFPAPLKQAVDIDTYLKHVEEVYITDAYHSLSIEGYKVSGELIERVRSGEWQPNTNPNDAEHSNALAARGYWQAHKAVKYSIRKIMSGDNPGQVVKSDLGEWYNELFAPSVVAGILRPSDLAGYRNHPVYIRHSTHVPPSREIVRDAMPALYELLAEEEIASVRAILGHFMFVYIHPFMDGNGRIGRFLMNSMLASGGHSRCCRQNVENAYLCGLLHNIGIPVALHGLQAIADSHGTP